MEKWEMRNFLIKVVFAVGSVGFSIWAIYQVIFWMGDQFQENAKHVQEKAQADMAKAKQEAEGKGK